MPPIFITLQHLVPQRALTQLAGRLARSKRAWIKKPFIKLFAKAYKVNMAEAERENLSDYHSFNDFFCRALKPEARPIAPAPALACPADGAVSQYGKINDGQIFQAKGHSYSATALLGSEREAEHYQHGEFATIYLSPSDYHRVHMPLTGRLLRMRYIPGELFSVNTLTTEHVPGLFARNERVVCLFETAIGEVAVILVGAMIVGSVETVWAGTVAPNDKREVTEWRYEDDRIVLEQGDELGRFKLGSTVVMLFPQGGVNWGDVMGEGSAVRMGDGIGKVGA